MKIDEKEFSKDLDLIRDDIYLANASFYTYIEIHRVASDDKAIFEKLNENAEFWNIILHALQNNFFITLGRIFDDDPKGHSIHKVINNCIGHAEFFSKESLSKRKEKSELPRAKARGF